MHKAVFKKTVTGFVGIIYRGATKEYCWISEEDIAELFPQGADWNDWKTHAIVGKALREQFPKVIVKLGKKWSPNALVFD